MRRLRLPIVPKSLRWAAVLSVAGVILYYSIRTAPGSGTFRTGPLGLVPFSDWLHFLAYGGLAVTLAYALHDSPRPGWQILAVVFIVAFSYGAAIELLQATLPARTFAIEDMLVNAIGAAAAIGCWRMLARHTRFYHASRPTDLEGPIE